MEPLSPPLLARTRRSDRMFLEWVGENSPTATEEYVEDEYVEDESVDKSPFYNVFATTNFIVENSFQVVPDPEFRFGRTSEPEIREQGPELWDRDIQFFSVNDQILYLDNRNLIVLDYKPTYENNKP